MAETVREKQDLTTGSLGKKILLDGKKYKKYEFRSWKTNYRGKILIHAGLTLEKNYSEKYGYF